MFNGLDRGVHTVKRAVAFVSDLDVDSAAFSILSRRGEEEGKKKKEKKKKGLVRTRAVCKMDEMFF